MIDITEKGALACQGCAPDLATMAGIVLALLSTGVFETYVLTCLQATHPVWIAVGMMGGFTGKIFADLSKSAREGGCWANRERVHQS